MNTFIPFFCFLTILSIATLCSFVPPIYEVDEALFVIHEVDPRLGKLKLYWKDKEGNRIQSLRSLKEYVAQQGKQLVFATNGGMYHRDGSPQGLFVQEGKLIHPLDSRQEGYGNFYLQPNGIFYLTEDLQAHVIQTSDFRLDSEIAYATQSGPMLLIDGSYHPKLTKGSSNLHIRNGVGVLPDGKVLFAMSKEKVNFYDLATLFKQRGCTQALYLDGFVSRTYLPAADWEQLDGHFGVMIGEAE